MVKLGLEFLENALICKHDQSGDDTLCYQRVTHYTDTLLLFKMFVVHCIRSLS